MATDDLRVVALPLSQGQVGLTLCPGLQMPNHARLSRDLSADLAVVQTAGYTTALVLLEDWELALFAPNLLDGYVAHGLQVVRHPIADGETPADLEGFLRCIAKVWERLGAGQKVLLHCRRGLGRTGMVGACLLVADGADASSAIRQVRLLQPGAVSSEEQEQFVARFQQGWTESPPTWG